MKPNQVKKNKLSLGKITIASLMSNQLSVIKGGQNSADSPATTNGSSFTTVIPTTGWTIQCPSAMLL